MAKINGPEISRGFWITIGVLIALMVLSAVTMAWHTIAGAA